MHLKMKLEIYFSCIVTEHDYRVFYSMHVGCIQCCEMVQKMSKANGIGVYKMKFLHDADKTRCNSGIYRKNWSNTVSFEHVLYATTGQISILLQHVPCIRLLYYNVAYVESFNIYQYVILHCHTPYAISFLHEFKFRLFNILLKIWISFRLRFSCVRNDSVIHVWDFETADSNRMHNKVSAC